MGHRSKSSVRCERCRVHVELCLCSEMPVLELTTHVALVMHCRELRKPTATGPLALSTLINSSLHVHGRPERPLDLNPLFQPDRRVLLLFPSEDAVPVSEWVRHRNERPSTLVVPDGNWRQASRAAGRIPGLERAERVTLPPAEPTRWGLRRETKDGGLATFEAIARALGYLEGAQVQQRLERFFLEVVRRQRGVREGTIALDRLRDLASGEGAGP